MQAIIFRLVMRLERFLVRHVHRSLVSRLLARKLGMAPVPTLLLTTIGRKSGRRIELPLFYVRSGPAYVVIASKGGAPDHPDWYKNLRATPAATIYADGRDIAVTARSAEGEERRRLWQLARDAYPTYDEYQAKAGTREIPVVMLEPA